MLFVDAYLLFSSDQPIFFFLSIIFISISFALLACQSFPYFSIVIFLNFSIICLPSRITLSTFFVLAFADNKTNYNRYKEQISLYLWIIA